MCQTCTNLRGRVTSLLLRINNTRTWDKTAHDVRGGAYQVLLKGLQHHFVEEGHFVDSSEVLMALGRRALDGLK